MALLRMLFLYFLSGVFSTVLPSCVPKINCFCLPCFKMEYKINLQTLARCKGGFEAIGFYHDMKVGWLAAAMFLFHSGKR